MDSRIIFIEGHKVPLVFHRTNLFVVLEAILSGLTSKKLKPENFTRFPLCVFPFYVKIIFTSVIHRPPSLRVLSQSTRERHIHTRSRDSL